MTETGKIVEKNKICKRKDHLCRKFVTDSLLALGYDASICKSRWENSSFRPTGTISLYLFTSFLIDNFSSCISEV